MSQLIIRNANIVQRNKILKEQMLIIRDGKIASIAADQANYDLESDSIDAEGRLVSPGLIDIQINGGFGFDFTQNPESIWEVGRQFLRFGVTGFLPTIITSPIPQINEALARWNNCKPQNYLGAMPFGWHIEGPFLNPDKKGAHQAEYLRSPDSAIISGWNPKNGVRLVTLAPELPGQEDMVKKLVANGVIVSIGHSNASFEQAQHAFNWGASAGTHLFNAMPTLNHRSPGLTGALLTNDTIYTGIIADGIHVHPSMVKLAYLAKGAHRLVLITDAMQALGMQPGAYQLAGKEVLVKNSTARLNDGTLAGSVLSLPEALKNIIRFTGCPLWEAFAMASTTPAQLLGITSKGSIAPGKDADLVIWDQDFQAHKVIIAGFVQAVPS